MNSNNQLITGERARLIPVKKRREGNRLTLSDIQGDSRACKAVWSDAGANVGSRAKNDRYSEVVFRSDELKK